MNAWSHHENKSGNSALRISAAYAVTGCLWILFSDTVLSLFLTDPDAITRLQMFKGLVFIAVTSALLFILVDRDMSVMRRSERALREREQTFRTLANTAAAAIFIYGDAFITVNRATEKLTGYAEGELRSMRFYDLFHPDFSGMIKDHCDALPRDGNGPKDCELKLITKEGDERWIDFSSSIIEYEGKKCGLGTAFDITARKQAEKTLKESEERLRLLVERVRDYEIFMLVYKFFHTYMGYLLLSNRVVLEHDLAPNGDGKKIIIITA